jgi:hypothetical protein
MSVSDHHPNNHCGSDCECCAVAERPSPTGPFRGGRFAAASASVFLLPLTGTVAGALVLRDAGAGQVAGGVGGFVLGTFLAVACLGRLNQSSGETA